MLPVPVGSDIYQAYHDAAREQKTVNCEARSPSTDGCTERTIYPSEEGLTVYCRDITDRKRLEDGMAYDAYLLEHVHDAVIATDAQLAVTAWNKGAERMYGWRADEALGRHVWEVVPTDLDDQQRAEALKEVGERGPYRVEGVTYGKDGVRVNVEGITIALRGRNTEGPITGYLNIRRDVTERRRAEAARREANERIESVLEGITDRFFAIDAEWRYTFFNSRAKEQLRGLGKNPETMIGKVLWQEFPNATSEAELQLAMRDRVATVDEKFCPPIGEWYENRIFPAPDGGLVVFQSSVTAKKEVEEKLRRSEGYLAEGQRLTHTGSWAWNVSTGHLFWSEEHFRICGLDPQKEQPSYPRMHWVHPDDRAMVQESFEKAIGDRTDFELDCRVLWTDGTIRNVHSFGHPVFDPAGDLTEYVGTILDTTERKQQEDARRKLVGRLFDAQEEERGRISRDLHDDLGQHVSAIGVRLAALKDGRGGDANFDLQVESLEAIVKQLGSAVDLIAWQLRPAALDDLGLGAALASHVERWSAHLDVTTEVHVSGIETDVLPKEHEIGLYRIAQEALNNVAKHARARNVAVLLQRRSDQVWLIVEDDGVGFDTAQVFAARGTRLGVAGMRERASLLGGTLDVESNPGRGTTLVARIPVFESHSPERRAV
jgi:PAS domain S-box-containing protein